MQTRIGSASGHSNSSSNGVPYTGATQDVNLGTHALLAAYAEFSVDGVYLDNGGAIIFTDPNNPGSNFGVLNGASTGGYQFSNPSQSGSGILDFSGLNSTVKIFTFPNSTGTIPSAILGRAVNQSGAVSPVATQTVGAADASFIISSNVLVTTATLHNFSVTCTYTDESNTSRTLTLNFSQLTGAFITAITNVTGAGTYEGIPLHIRCKAGTTITIASTGTFTTIAYNIEGNISQIT